MTGFGRHVSDGGTARIVCEARSLNSRGLQVIVRLPEPLSSREEAVRELVRGSFARGRIEVSLSIEETSPSAGSGVDSGRAGALCLAGAELAERLGIPFSMTVADLMRMPGVINPPGAGIDSSGLDIEPAVRGCLEDLRRSRAAEGEVLAASFAERLGRVRRIAGEIQAGAAGRVAERFRRLRERVVQLLEGSPVDEARLAQELAVLADRLDTSEEYERLNSHVDNCLSMLASSEPDSGRRLSFLLQELQREANTLGSKLDDPAAVMSAIEMKNELASMREQVANVE